MSYGKVEFENAILYHGDCLDVMKDLGPVDAVVTDPPYGIGEAAGKNKSRGKLAVAKDFGCSEWDNKTPSNEHIQAMLKAGRNQIVFGGNYFDLGATSCFLVWDKKIADCSSLQVMKPPSQIFIPSKFNLSTSGTRPLPVARLWFHIGGSQLVNNTARIKSRAWTPCKKLLG